MKFTKCLWRQHLGRMTKYNWYWASKKVPLESGAESVLAAKGIKVEDATEVIKPPPLPRIENIEHLCPRPLSLDKSHPDWNERSCLTYGDNNLLLRGVPQAQLLTKTMEIKDELPERIEALLEKCPLSVDPLVQRAVRTSSLYDAHQELLPKIKDPNRPAFNFPRVLGITDLRRIRNISQKLIQICESLSPLEVIQKRKLVHDGIISLPIEKEDDLLQFNLTMDLMITSSECLLPVKGKNELNSDLPSLEPLHHTISLIPENIYKLQNLYPVDSKAPWKNVHTVFAHYNPVEVKNLTELPVAEDQILARSMIKSFVAAAGCARLNYGESVKELPEPVTVQCIQSDGKSFHFSVFQLNTLDLDGTDGMKNLWWSIPRIELFEKSQYENGRPVFEGYNPEVFKRIFAFYNNQ